MRVVLFGLGSGRTRARARGATDRRWRVEGGGCRAGVNVPASEARSAAAASSNAVRSRRSPVSTRSIRPVSGSMRVSSPTSTSASSRGSAISSAMTAWRPATLVRAGTQSRGPRKSDTTTTTPGVERVEPTIASARAGDVGPWPSSAGSVSSARIRPSMPRRPPAGGMTWLPAAPKVTMPRRLPRRAANRPTTSAAPSATSALRRSAVPKCIDGEWSSRSQAVSWRSGTSSRTCGCHRAGGGVPVDLANVVARLVRPDAVELHAVPATETAVVAAHLATDLAVHGDLELVDEPVRDRAGPGSGRRARPAADPREVGVGGHAVGSIASSRRGVGTSVRTRLTMVSGVTPSASAE